MVHARNGCITTSGVKYDVRVPRPRFPLRRGNFGDSAINKGYAAYFSLRMRESAVFPLPV